MEAASTQHLVVGRRAAVHRPNFWPKAFWARRGGRGALLSRSTGCAGCLEAVAARGQPEVALVRRATRRQKCQPCALLPPHITFFDGKFGFNKKNGAALISSRRGPGDFGHYSSALDWLPNAAWYMLSVRSELKHPDKYTSRTETHAAKVHIPPLTDLPQMRELLDNRHNYPESASPGTLTSHSRAAHAATASRHSRAAHSP